MVVKAYRTQGGDSRYCGKRRLQATAQAERQIHATNVCTRALATHVHSSSARAVSYMAKSRDARTNRQNGFIRRVLWLRWSIGVVLLLVLMQQYWRVKKRPPKEEVRFGVESALNYRRRWDQRVLMCRHETGVAPPHTPTPLLLLWLVNTKRQALKLGPDRCHATRASDARWQR